MSTKIVPPTITPGLRLAVDELRRDLGPTGQNYMAVRVVLSFCEALIKSRDDQVSKAIADLENGLDEIRERRQKNPATNSRQTGVTSEQIKTAPLFAIFVWSNNKTSYPVYLARHLGRKDLIFRPLSWLRMFNVCELRNHGVVVDHAAMLDTEGREALEHLRTRGVPVFRAPVNLNDLPPRG